MTTSRSDPKRRPRRELPALSFRVAEAATVLGVSEQFFRDAIAPELRWTRRGAVKLVSRTELERWLEGNAHRVLEGDD